MPTKEAIKELCDTCAALYDNHDKYPEKDIGHGMSHISGVATRAMVYQEAMERPENAAVYDMGKVDPALAGQSAAPDRMLALASAYLHDIGNEIGRSGHNHFSRGIVEGGLTIEKVLFMPQDIGGGNYLPMDHVFDKNVGCAKNILEAIHSKDKAAAIKGLTATESVVLSKAVRLCCQFEAAYNTGEKRDMAKGNADGKISWTSLCDYAERKYGIPLGNLHTEFEKEGKLKGDVTEDINNYVEKEINGDGSEKNPGWRDAADHVDPSDDTSATLGESLQSVTDKVNKAMTRDEVSQVGFSVQNHNCDFQINEKTGKLERYVPMREVTIGKKTVKVPDILGMLINDADKDTAPLEYIIRPTAFTANQKGETDRDRLICDVALQSYLRGERTGKAELPGELQVGKPGMYSKIVIMADSKDDPALKAYCESHGLDPDKHIYQMKSEGEMQDYCDKYHLGELKEDAKNNAGKYYVVKQEAIDNYSFVDRFFQGVLAGKSPMSCIILSFRGNAVKTQNAISLEIEQHGGKVRECLADHTFEKVAGGAIIKIADKFEAMRDAVDQYKHENGGKMPSWKNFVLELGRVAEVKEWLLNGIDVRNSMNHDGIMTKECSVEKKPTTEHVSAGWTKPDDPHQRRVEATQKDYSVGKVEWDEKQQKRIDHDGNEVRSGRTYTEQNEKTGGEIAHNPEYLIDKNTGKVSLIRDTATYLEKRNGNFERLCTVIKDINPDGSLHRISAEVTRDGRAIPEQGNIENRTAFYFAKFGSIENEIIPNQKVEQHDPKANDHGFLAKEDIFLGDKLDTHYCVEYKKDGSVVFTKTHDDTFKIDGDKVEEQIYQKIFHSADAFEEAVKGEEYKDFRTARENGRTACDVYTEKVKDHVDIDDNQVATRLVPVPKDTTELYADQRVAPNTKADVAEFDLYRKSGEHTTELVGTRVEYFATGSNHRIMDMDTVKRPDGGTETKENYYDKDDKAKLSVVTQSKGDIVESATYTKQDANDPTRQIAYRLDYLKDGKVQLTREVIKDGVVESSKSLSKPFDSVDQLLEKCGIEGNGRDGLGAVLGEAYANREKFQIELEAKNPVDTKIQETAEAKKQEDMEAKAEKAEASSDEDLKKVAEDGADDYKAATAPDEKTESDEPDDTSKKEEDGADKKEKDEKNDVEHMVDEVGEKIEKIFSDFEGDSVD